MSAIETVDSGSVTRILEHKNMIASTTILSNPFIGLILMLECHSKTVAR